MSSQSSQSLYMKTYELMNFVEESPRLSEFLKKILDRNVEIFEIDPEEKDPMDETRVYYITLWIRGGDEEGA